MCLGLHTLFGERYSHRFAKECILACDEFNALLERNVAASSNYHRAILKLAQLAGQNAPVSFGVAKIDCASCLEECRRTTDALRRHQAEHSCAR